MVMGELPLCVSSSVTVSPDKNVAAPAAFMSYQAPAAVQSASPEPQFKFCVKTMFPLVTGVSPVMPPARGGGGQRHRVRCRVGHTGDGDTVRAGEDDSRGRPAERSGAGPYR